MRLHRFIRDFDLSKNTLTITDEDLLNQWKNVLRLGSESHVILCDGNGQEAEASIETLSKKEAIVRIQNRLYPERENKNESTLYLALLKRENFELTVQKATELGIHKFVPLITTRTVKTGFNRVRIEKIILEASEQSGRVTLPTLSEPMQFTEAIKSVSPKDAVLFDASGSPHEAFHSSLSTINLLVGPEGGFTPEEIIFTKDNDIPIVNLGPLTLRAETAGIIVSYIGTHK